MVTPFLSSRLDQASAIGLGYSPRRIVRKSGEHGDLMSSTGEIFTSTGSERRDAGFVRPVVYPQENDVHCSASVDANRPRGNSAAIA